MEKIYRGNKFSSIKNKEIDVSKDDLVYRGSNSIIEQESKNINKDKLVYRGVSKDTAYYNLAKIRSAQKKRKLFHSGLELYAPRKYCY
jgi:hypothetical protein